MKNNFDEFFRKENGDILEISGTAWRRALALKKKKDNTFFKKIFRFFTSIWG
jgi:hypothetical protein